MHFEAFESPFAIDSINSTNLNAHPDRANYDPQFARFRRTVKNSPNPPWTPSIYQIMQVSRGTIALPRKGDLVLSVCSSIPWNRRRNEQRRARLRWLAARYRANQQSRWRWRHGARPYVKWWGGSDGRLSYIVTQSRWRAQSSGIRKHVKWAIRRREAYTGYTELCDSVELSVVALRYRKWLPLVGRSFFFLSSALRIRKIIVENRRQLVESIIFIFIFFENIDSECN